jgi:hypothetical protein
MKNKPLNIGEMAFDASLLDSLDKSLSPEEYKGEIMEYLEKILYQSFPNSPGKRSIQTHHDRITISCPYCGDSTQSDYKKRGNIILADKYSGNYKCFNCGVFIS